ncbi:hypothetical protein FMO13_05000 [Xanthomonas phaseoli pv. dieffenbachiae]
MQRVWQKTVASCRTCTSCAIVVNLTTHSPLSQGARRRRGVWRCVAGPNVCTANVGGHVREAEMTAPPEPGGAPKARGKEMRSGAQRLHRECWGTCPRSGDGCAP